MYVQLFIGVIGVIGNLILIDVFLRPSLRRLSYSFYAIVKACVDIIFLLNVFRFWLIAIFNINIVNLNIFFCKLTDYLLAVTCSTTEMLSLLISIDQVATVIYTNRFPALKKRSVQVSLVFLALVYSFLVIIIEPINSQIVEITYKNKTWLLCQMTDEVDEITSWLVAGAIIGLPTLINTVLNVRLLVFIILSRNKVNRATRNTSRRDRKFTIVSIVSNSIGVVCKTASGILIVMSIKHNWNSYTIALVTLIEISIFFLESSLPFFINIFINSIFYDEFMKLIRFRNNVIPARQFAPTKP